MHRRKTWCLLGTVVHGFNTRGGAEAGGLGDWVEPALRNGALASKIKYMNQEERGEKIVENVFQELPAWSTTGWGGGVGQEPTGAWAKAVYSFLQNVT